MFEDIYDMAPLGLLRIYTGQVGNHPPPPNLKLPLIFFLTKTLTYKLYVSIIIL